MLHNTLSSWSRTFLRRDKGNTVKEVSKVRQFSWPGIISDVVNYYGWTSLLVCGTLQTGRLRRVGPRLCFALNCWQEVSDFGFPKALHNMVTTSLHA